MKSMYRLKTLFITLLIVLPSIGQCYLNEQTVSLVKSKRLVQYKEVAITEQVDTDGVVRKVSWQGMHHPELKSLMGPCYSYYRDYLKANKQLRLRGAMTLNSNGCHINVGGHMRSVHGEVSIDNY